MDMNEPVQKKSPPKSIVMGKAVEQPDKRSFEGKIVGSELHLREDLAELLASQRPSTSLSAFRMLKTYAGAYAESLGWTEKEYRNALEELKTNVLSEVFSDDELNGAKMPRRKGVFGAFSQDRKHGS